MLKRGSSEAARVYTTADPPECDEPREEVRSFHSYLHSDIPTDDWPEWAIAELRRRYWKLFWSFGMAVQATTFTIKWVPGCATA